MDSVQKVSMIFDIEIKNFIPIFVRFHLLFFY